MSDYFERLLARTHDPTRKIRPRSIARYEPASSVRPTGFAQAGEPGERVIPADAPWNRESPPPASLVSAPDSRTGSDEERIGAQTDASDHLRAEPGRHALSQQDAPSLEAVDVHFVQDERMGLRADKVRPKSSARKNEPVDTGLIAKMPASPADAPRTGEVVGRSGPLAKTGLGDGAAVVRPMAANGPAGWAPSSGPGNAPFDARQLEPQTLVTRAEPGALRQPSALTTVPSTMAEEFAIGEQSAISGGSIGERANAAEAPRRSVSRLSSASSSFPTALRPDQLEEFPPIHARRERLRPATSITMHETSDPSSSPEPVVHVTIGRLEIRTAAPERRISTTKRAEVRSPRLSLRDYLERRGEGRR